MNYTNLYHIDLHLSGSLQNPAWSPDCKSLSFTRWRGGYNKGEAEVWVHEFDSGRTYRIARGNAVSQPGSCWREEGGVAMVTGGIIMSRAPDDESHDEVWRWTTDGLDQLTNRHGYMAYEPSWAPDGKRFVFESHVVDQEDHGQIMIGTLGRPMEQLEFVTLDGRDCRQPNWSPDGQWIVYQEHEHNDWRLHFYNVALKAESAINVRGDATDATFTPDSKAVLYSGAYGELDGCLLVHSLQGEDPPFVGKLVVGKDGQYFGAPSWGSNGKIVCEWGYGDPDSSGEPTKLVLFEAPEIK